MLNYNSLLPDDYNDAAVDYNGVSFSGSAPVNRILLRVQQERVLIRPAQEIVFTRPRLQHLN